MVELFRIIYFMLATQQILHIIKFINLLQKLNKTEKGESNNCTWSKFLPTCREKRSFWFPLLNKQCRTKTKTKTIGQETRNINYHIGTIIKQWNLNDKFI